MEMDPLTAPQSFKSFYTQATGFTQGELDRITAFFAKAGYEFSWSGVDKDKFAITGPFPTNDSRIILTSKDLSVVLVKEALHGDLQIQRLLECYKEYWRGWKKFEEIPPEQAWVEKLYLSRTGG